MDQKIIDLYDEYTHAPLPRRVFLERLAVTAGGAAAVSAILPLLENNYARAAKVSETDPRIATGTMTFTGATGPVNGYLAMPASGSTHPAVVVIHENRGLNPHIEDVTRRLATDGFLAMAVDALSPMGGTPDDQDQARDMIGKLDPGTTVGNYLAAVSTLKGHEKSNGKVGCVGFCWGGGMANQLAVRSRDLSAAVAYYGRQPQTELVPQISAPVLLHYAGLDTRINAGMDAYAEALKANGKRFEMHVYEGVNHAFNNDTNPARYDEAAAKVAWDRTVDFLKRELTA